MVDVAHVTLQAFLDRKKVTTYSALVAVLGVNLAPMARNIRAFLVALSTSLSVVHFCVAAVSLLEMVLGGVVGGELFGAYCAARPLLLALPLL